MARVCCLSLGLVPYRGGGGGGVPSGPQWFAGVSGAGCGFRVGWRAAGGWGLISIFRGFSSSVGGACILAGGLGAGLSFYGV